MGAIISILCSLSLTIMCLYQYSECERLKSEVSEYQSDVQEAIVVQTIISGMLSNIKEDVWSLIEENTRLKEECEEYE